MRRHSPPIPETTAVVGVDIAKRRFVAWSGGPTSKARSYGNDAAGFARFSEYLDGVGRDGELVVAFEPTGHYGERLIRWLEARDVRLFQVQPVHTKRAKELFDGTRRKTDAKDARVIAKPCAPPRGVFADLRVLSRHRESLVKRRSQLQNRLHHHLDVVFPELLEHFHKLRSAACLALLQRAPTPADLLEQDPDELTELLYRTSRHQLGAETMEAIRAAASTSTGVRAGIAAHRLGIRQQVAQLQAIDVDITAVEAEMVESAGQVEYVRRLVTIPRLGVLTVAILLGEFGDLRGYRVNRQLIAMAGLDLIEQSSGERRGRRTISRRGRRYARQILYLAVLRLGWTTLSERRRRLVEDNKLPPTRAAVANMCCLLRIIHAIVRDGVDFDPSRHEAPPIIEEEDVAA